MTDHPKPPPPPRQSIPTTAGVGAIEARRALHVVQRRDPTPESPFSAVREPEPSKAEQVSMRGLTGQFAEVKELIGKALNALAQKQHELEQSHATAQASGKTEREALEAKIKTLSEAVADMGQHVLRLDTTIGRPGGIDLRASNVEDLTADELAKGEKEGTGLHRLFFQLANTDRKIITTVAKAAGTRAGTVSSVVTSATATAPVWIPALVDAVQKLFGG